MGRARQGREILRRGKADIGFISFLFLLGTGSKAEKAFTGYNLGTWDFSLSFL